MTPQAAQTLEHGDCILYQGQLYQVAQVFHHGNLVHLTGKLGDQIVSPRHMTLVWRKDEVPPDTQLGHLTTEEEARLRAMVAARSSKDMGKETERTG